MWSPHPHPVMSLLCCQDLEARSIGGRGASKQHTVCCGEWELCNDESTAQVNRDTAIISKRESTHLQLCAHLKDFAAEKSVAEREAMTTDSLEERLAEPLTQGCGESSRQHGNAAASECTQRVSAVVQFKECC